MRSGEKRSAPTACPLHPADESTAWLLLLRHASAAAAVPHLQGRWLRVDLRASVAGSIGALAAGELTPGRLPGAAETSWTVKAGEAR